MSNYKNKESLNDLSRRDKMRQFKYIISGEYKDWCEIYKGDLLIHDGSILGIIKEIENGICFRTNYGTQNYFYSVLKRFNSLIVTVPKKPDFLKKDYLYQPLYLEEQEFNSFMDVTYSDSRPLNNLSKITKNDLVNIWLLSNPTRKNFSDEHEMRRETLLNILFFSDNDYELSLLNEQINDYGFSINEIPNNSESIIIYMDGDEGIYEWNGLIKIDEKVYLKLDDDYYMK